MNLTVVQGLHGALSLFHVNDGFHFRCYRVREFAAYFRCTEFQSGCPVRGLIRVGENFHTNNEIHSHEPNFQLIPSLQERRILMEESRRLDIASLQEIFHERRLVRTTTINFLQFD